MIGQNDSNFNFILRFCAVTLVVCLLSHCLPGVAQSQQQVPWQFDLEKAKQIASEENKPVLLHFSANWCAPCKELERFVFVNPTAVRALNDLVVPVKVDVDSQADVAEEYDIQSVPSDVIITSAGHVIATRKSPRSADSYQAMIASAVERSKNLTEESIARSEMIRQSSKTGYKPPSNTAKIAISHQKDSRSFEAVAKPTAHVAIRNSQFQLTEIDHPTGIAQPSITQKTHQDAAGNSDPVALKLTTAESKMAAAERPAAAAATKLPEVGLDGYCCVSLIKQQKWVKGDSRIGCIHRGKLYFFQSTEKRDLFQMTPDMFSPLLGGADPVVFHQSGQLTEGQRQHGVFYGDDEGPQVIVLFKNKTNRDLFESDPSPFLATVRQAMSRLDEEKILR